MAPSFSPPTPWQAELLHKLLSINIEGVEELRQQAESAKTQTVDEDGSFKVRTDGPTWTKHSRRVPIEAETKDSDDTTIQILVHVINGLIDEIEIYRVDGEKAPAEFDLNKISVTISV